MYDIFVRLLAERGVTTADVCKATGISQSTLSNWKKRNNVLSPALLGKIADYFHVSLDYMMGKEENPAAANTIFERQDIVKISDEAKHVAMIYDKLPPEVQKSIRTLLKYSEQRP